MCCNQWYRHEKPNISDDIADLLVDLELAKWNSKGDLELSPSLCGTMMYPCRGYGCERVSSFFPRSFQATESHQNAQVVNGMFCVAYICKYLAGAEERTVVRWAQTSKTTCKVQETDRHLRKRHKNIHRPAKNHHGKGISTTEIATHLLRLPPMFSTWDCRFVEIGPMERRYTTLKRNWKPDEDDHGTLYGMSDDETDVDADPTRCGGVQVANRWQPNHPQREPHVDATRVYQRWSNSRTNADSVMVYGLRPPEWNCLLIDKYFKFAIFFPKKGIVKREWIIDWVQHGFFDLHGTPIKLRCTIFQAPHLLHKIFVTVLGANHVLHEMVTLLHTDSSNHNIKVICWEHTKPLVVVFPTYGPGDQEVWECHNAITTTVFHDESTLLPQILGSRSGRTPTQIRSLLQSFILTDLMFWPISYHSRWQHTRRAYASMHGEVRSTIVWATTTTELELEMQNKYEDHRRQVKGRHHGVICKMPQSGSDPSQTIESYHEQRGTLPIFVARLRCIRPLQVVRKDPTYRMQPLYISAPPGAGKTFLLLCIAIMIENMYHGAVVYEITALSALRAAHLGGWHIHALFGFVATKKGKWVTARALAAIAMARLDKNMVLRRFLQEVAVLLIDEVMQVGGEVLAAMDYVLQKVRGVDLIFRGIFVVASGDHYQNEPIDQT